MIETIADHPGIGRPWTELDTPSLLLDIDVLDENIRTMARHAIDAGKQIRPHAKTHKCSRIAQRQMDAGGCVGISVATLGEAEGLIDAGIGEILITSPVTPAGKVSRLMACRRRTDRIVVAVDNSENVNVLNSAAAGIGEILDVLIDVDPGMGRTGVLPEGVHKLWESIARCPNIRIRGIQCYAGNAQHVKTYTERRDQSIRQMMPAAKAFRDLQSEGIEVDIFSGAGTGTFDIDTDIPELTDLQVGSYCLMDSGYGVIGGREDALSEKFGTSLSVHASIIHLNPAESVTIDAGLKALYFTPDSPPVVLDRSDETWRYEWLGDEHGRLWYPEQVTVPRLGSSMRLSAPHCDPTVNLYTRYFVIREGIVIDVWPVDLKDR